MPDETAEAVLETGPVCDGCLGRCLGDREADRSSETRGEAIRHELETEMGEQIDPVDPAACWVCEGLTVDIESWTDRALEAVTDLGFETFQVGTRVPSAIEDHEAELRESVGLDADAGESINAEYNRGVGSRLEEHLDAMVEFEYPDVVVILDLEAKAVELQLNPAYLGGRYRKLETGLGPRVRICRACNGEGSEWREGEAMPCEACDGSGYDTKESVEWYIAESIRTAMEGDEAVFNAAGGEGASVLVRGEGRPFVVEVKAPRNRPADTEAIRDAIHTASDGAIAVDGLAWASRDLVEHLTQTAITETYRFEVSFADPVAESTFEAAVETLDGGSIRQRVERGDRVADLIKRLGAVDGELTDDRRGAIELESTKEIDLEAVMVGGADRSEPNLADLLGTAVTCESVAVVAVEGDDDPLDLSGHLTE